MSETRISNDCKRVRQFSENQQKLGIDALQSMAAAGRIVAPPLQSASPNLTMKKFRERTYNVDSFFETF